MGTQFTGVASGNASNPAVWNVGVVVPGVGDTVLTGAFNITWDMTSTLGNDGGSGSEALQVQTGGSLTIPEGITLTGKGDVNVQKGGTYNQIGHLVLDTGAGFTRFLKQLSTGTGYAAFNINGPSKTNRATLSKTGTGVARFDANAGGSLLASKMNISNMIVFDFGSSSLKAFDHYMFNATTTSYATDVAFIRCGRVAPTIAHADNILQWNNILISKPIEPLNSIYISGSSSKSGSGVRSVSNLYIYSDVPASASLYAADLTVNALYGVNTTIGAGLTSSLRQSHTGHILLFDEVIPMATALFSTVAKLSSIYTDITYLARYKNQHYCGGSAGVAGNSNVWTGTIFDGDGFVSYDAGDCFTNAEQIDALNALIINKAGAAFSGLSTTSNINLKNATVHDAFHIAVGESNGSANQIKSVVNCLFSSIDMGMMQLALAQSMDDTVVVDYNGFWNMTTPTNLTHPITGTRSYMGAESKCPWFVTGSFDGRDGRGMHDVNADPQFKDSSRTIRTWFGSVLGVDTSSPATWTVTQLGAELIKGSGLDKDGAYTTSLPALTAANCRAYLREGFTPTNPAYKGTGLGGVDIGAVPVDADTTAPVLTGATATVTGQATATLRVTTDTAEGVADVVVTTSATKPSAAQIQAGTDHTGSAAPYHGQQAVTAAGQITFSATGLAASTTYYAHFTHEDLAGNDAAVVSSAEFTTDAIPHVNTPPTGSVTISGTPTQGQTLTASNTIADVDDIGTITYTWRANGTIVGTGTTYVLQAGDVGDTVTVTASYTDGYGAEESVTSNPVGPVTALPEVPLLMPPIPLQAGHGGAPVDQAARHSVDAGPARVRRRYFNRYETLNVAWMMNGATFAAFRDWYYSASGANGGAAWFSLYTALDGDSPIVLVSARFSGPYKWELVGPKQYSVTATVEVRDA